VGDWLTAVLLASALAACLRDLAVQAARPLDGLLKDWGQDDLLPAALKTRVRRAAHL